MAPPGNQADNGENKLHPKPPRQCSTLPFDLRPALWKGKLYTTYNVYNKKLKYGYQGAIGVELEKAFLQINEFFSNKNSKKELVILDFSHFIDWDNRDEKPELDSNQRNQFIDLVKKHLSMLLVKCPATNLCEQTTEKLINSGTYVRN